MPNIALSVGLGKASPLKRPLFNHGNTSVHQKTAFRTKSETWG